MFGLDESSIPDGCTAERILSLVAIFGHGTGSRHWWIGEYWSVEGESRF